MRDRPTSGRRVALADVGLGALADCDELHDEPVRLADDVLRTIAAVARSAALPLEAVHRSLAACARLARSVDGAMQVDRRASERSKLAG